jgi:hypothetical protein
MGVIAFTDREMRRAWRENKFASSKTSQTTNSHRLLLFYAVECGLKAVLMQREGVNCTNQCPKILEAQHDLNKLLDFLSAGQLLRLPNQFKMPPISINGKNIERKINSGTINQMWRYGGKGEGLADQDLESRLIKIVNWIEQQI